MTPNTLRLLTSDTIARIVAELDGSADQMTLDDLTVMRAAVTELFKSGATTAISLLSSYDVSANNPIVVEVMESYA